MKVDVARAKDLGELTRVVCDAVKVLSSQCDGAIRKDDVGFNKMDASYGRYLSRRIQYESPLSQEEVTKAAKMLLKYHGQLSDDINGTLRDKLKVLGQIPKDNS